MPKTSGETAIREFKHQKQKEFALYDYSRPSLEFLGERLLLFQKFEQAIAIYKLIAEEDPAYTASYYYIGMAYQNWGKMDEALSIIKWLPAT